MHFQEQIGRYEDLMENLKMQIYQESHIHVVSFFSYCELNTSIVLYDQCLQESYVITLIIFTRVVLIQFDHWNSKPYEKDETTFCVF